MIRIQTCADGIPSRVELLGEDGCVIMRIRNCGEHQLKIWKQLEKQFEKCGKCPMLKEEVE